MLGALRYICDWNVYFKETVMLFPAKRERKMAGAFSHRFF